MIIWSGVENNVTLGTPICWMVNNEDVKKKDYSKFESFPRPGHGDYTYMLKYGTKASSGGGRSSARETIGRVIAGSIAEKYLCLTFNTKFISWVVSVGDIWIPKEENLKIIDDLLNFDRGEVDKRGTFLIFEFENERVYIDYTGTIRDNKGEEICKEESNQSEILKRVEEQKYTVEIDQKCYRF